MAIQDSDKWQKAIQGIETERSNLSDRELFAFNSLKTLLNSGNFDNSNSLAFIHTLKSALSSHSKHRLLKAHLTSFLSLCDQYFTATAIPAQTPTQAPIPTQAPLSPPQPHAAPQPAPARHPFSAIHSSDIVTFQELIAKIEAKKTDLSAEECSAFESLKRNAENGTFELAGISTCFQILKRHTKNRLLAVLLPKFVALCERYFKEPSTAERATAPIPPHAPTASTSGSDTDNNMLTFEPPVLIPPVRRPEQVSYGSAVRPKEQGKKVSNTKTYLVFAIIALLIGVYFVWQNWEQEPVRTVRNNFGLLSADSVSITSETLQLKLGDTTEFTAKVYPEYLKAEKKSVTWKSSDSSVLSIEGNGKVIAIGAGSAVVSAYVISGPSASCQVTVNDIFSQDVEQSNVEQQTVSNNRNLGDSGSSSGQNRSGGSGVSQALSIAVPCGIYTGELKSNQPHGMGTIRYDCRTLIDSRDPQKRYAEAGQYIVGQFREGRLLQGRLYDRNGNQIGVIIIGGGVH